MPVDPLPTVLGKLEKVTGSGGRYKARCPAHDDDRPSLTVDLGKQGQVLLKCFAGCTFEAILAALDLSASDLYPENGKAKSSQLGEIATTYDYVDEDGVLLFQTVRLLPKDFKQRRPDGRGGWIWKLDNTRRVLFRLPQLRKAIAEGRPVYVAEGEKDVLSLEVAGVAATCNPMGAGKWRDQYSETLRGADVVIVQDEDEPGRAHARRIAEALQALARGVRIVAPALGKDAHDHLTAGKTLADFRPVETDMARASTAVARAHVITLSDVQVEPVRWLWTGRIPYGKITVLEGDPGLGKSQLTLALAAALTTGRALPGCESGDAAAGEPGDVLLLTGEDGLSDTVKPRLQAAGGDPARVHVLQGVPDPERPGEFRFPSLPDDVSHLLAEIRERQVRLVIVDTLTTYLGAKYNSFKDADVRRALAPLAHVAEITGCAIVLIRHLTKQSRGKAITAGGGSIGIGGGARSCLLLAEDPDTPNLRVLAVVKANLAKKADSLTLTIEEAVNGWPHVVWTGTSAHSADDLIAARAEEVQDKKPIEEACDLLRSILAAGTVAEQEIERRATEADIKEKTLRRAKKKLNVISERRGFGKAPWYWRLPNSSTEDPTHYTWPGGHLSANDPVSASPATSHIDGQGEWPSKQEPGMAMLASDARQRCSIHPKVPFRRRRGRCAACWVCIAPDSKAPYLEPLPGPGDPEYEAYCQVPAA
jgi:putative DNA primase/helicase